MICEAARDSDSRVYVNSVLNKIPCWAQSDFAC
jgi:hypothetical protein